MSALARQVRLFNGVVEYTRRFRPKLVICENVAGLLKRNSGCEPHINSVRMAFGEYTRRFGPKLVICEKVDGLLKRNRGCEPQIHSTRI